MLALVEIGMKETDELKRSIAELSEKFRALVAHLELVVEAPYVDSYGTVHGRSTVRIRCKECGR